MIWLYFQTEFYPWLRLVPWSSTAGEVLVTTVTKRGSQEMLCQYIKQLISTQVVYISNSWLLCECTLGYLENVHNLSSEMTKVYYVLRSWHCMSLGLQTGNWQAVLWLLLWKVEFSPLLYTELAITGLSSVVHTYSSKCCIWILEPRYWWPYRTSWCRTLHKVHVADFLHTAVLRHAEIMGWEGLKPWYVEQRVYNAGAINLVFLLCPIGGCSGEFSLQFSVPTAARRGMMWEGYGCFLMWVATKV